MASLSGSLEVVPIELKGEYLNVIATDVVKGQALVEFSSFETPRRFLNVFNTIESPGDVTIMERVFSNSYLDESPLEGKPYLGDKMKGRYERLLQKVADGTFTPNGSSFSERLAVLEETKNIRTGLYEQLTGEKYHKKAFALRRRNIAYGSYNITLPNGQTISNNFISVAGEGVSNNITQELGNQFSGRTIIPEVNQNNQKFAVTRLGADHDSERKFFEYIVNLIEQRANISINPLSGVYSGFTGEIYVNSEMLPCNSCTDIMINQLQQMFGQNNIKVNVEYGVEFP